MYNLTHLRLGCRPQGGSREMWAIFIQEHFYRPNRVRKSIVVGLCAWSDIEKGCMNALSARLGIPLIQVNE